MQQSDALLNEILLRLKSEFHPSAIYLFGSMARGDFTEDSDYDLMLVVPDPLQEPQYRRMQRAQKVLWGIWTAVDVVIFTESEFEQSRKVICSLPTTVLREGKKLDVA